MVYPIHIRQCLPLLFLTTIAICGITAQDCLEYDEIGGTDCVACVPDGWSLFGGTSPDIILGDGTWPGGGCTIEDLEGESPGGGTMSFFVAQGGSYEEGMTTTVSGLNTGQEYGFGLYWQNVVVNNCGMWEGGDLLIELDGEQYIFSGAEEWEYIEICFTPSSSDVDINLNIIGDGGMNALVVDSPSCDQVSPCCPLFVDIEEEEYELCPGEEFIIPGVFSEEEGSVTIEWTSDPSSGIIFLDETDIIQPTFLVDDVGDFEGGVYTFELKVEDDNCEKIREIEITVLPSITPEFDIFICEAYEIPPFPEESIDGYFGTWDGNFNFDEIGGTVQEYTFILDPGQDNCIEEWVYEYPIQLAEDLSIDFQNIFCETDEDRYTLPDETEENVEGEWDEDRIRPSELGEGVYIYTFFPDTEEYCAFPMEFEFEVLASDSLSFNLPKTYCATGDTIFLPETSIEFIQGEWDDDFIVLDDTGSYTIDFEVEDPNDCYYDFEYTFTIGESAEASFDLELNLCQNFGTFSPESNSVEGYEGVWTPNEILIDTISQDSLILNWSPLDDFNGCLKDTNITFYIISPNSLEFTLPDSLCISDLPYILPVVSNNGLNGTWSQANITNTVQVNNYVNLSFIGDASTCNAVYQDSIFIRDTAQPEFNLNVSLCANEEAVLLPEVSMNGIEGTWSINPVDPTTFEDSLLTVFRPLGNSCADSITISFYILEQIEPVFVLPEFLCAENGVFDLPDPSGQNIPGTWTNTSYDPASFDAAIFTSSFIPDDISCYNTVDVSIPVASFDGFSFSTTDPLNCVDPDGSIIFENNMTSQFEFSIDGGVNWTDSNYSDLSSGAYELLVRSVDFPDCIKSYDFILASPESVVINDLIVVDNISCANNDGSIEIIAQGNDLEYSIDNGVNWQSEAFFDNLNPGTYEVLARSAIATDCNDGLSANVNAFAVTNIEMLDQTALTNCNANDAMVDVTATGETLEYSIDDGANWQEESTFNNLEAGEYTILVRSSIDLDCIESIDFTVEDIELPEILELISSDISDCGLSDGTIQVIVDDEENYEYSIDGGMTWQSSNLFFDLPEGNYTIEVRDLTYNACQDNAQTAISAKNNPVILDTELIGMSDCITTDARFNMVTDLADPEFSIDGGIEWQSSSEFSGLGEGNYSVIVRSISSPNCTASTDFDVIRPNCPCNELNYSFIIENPNCLDPLSGSVEIIDLNGFYTDLDFQIEWSNGEQGANLNNIPEGSYSFTIEYDLDCQLTDSLLLDAADPLSFDLLSFDQDCEGLGSIEVTNLDGGSGDFLFSIDGVNFQESSVFFNLSADQYNILVQDAFNCDSLASTSISDVSNLELELPEIQPIRLGESVILNPLINASTIDDFEWSPQEGVLNQSELIAEVSPTETTEYTLTIYFGDCIETRSIIVEVLQPDDVYLPNIFNPNDIGNNSYFFPQAINDLDLTIDALSVYDRWGNLVFINENFKINIPEEGWDGYYNDRKTEVGVYVFMLEYNLAGRKEILAGSVTLIR